MVQRMGRGAAAAAWFGVAIVVSAAPAGALSTCQGSYAATSILPLPGKLQVDLDVRDRSPRNVRLAERFLAGVREVGVAVGGGQPNVLLHVSTSQLGGTASRASRGLETNYPELTGLQGGSQGSMQALPSTSVGPRTATQQPLLSLRIDATAGSDARVAWIASIQCRMTGSDEGRLAQELGRVIGSSLGQRVERRPL